METEEFVSELFFLVGEGKVLESSPKILDELYEKYSNKSSAELVPILKHFNEIISFILNLNLDFNEYKRLNWTTHIYGLFSFAWYCESRKIKPEQVENKLKQLYKEYFGKGTILEGAIKKYKDSASSRTNSESQRKFRLYAMLEYCGVSF
ncbi:MAG TPA: hypothetical protein VHT96_07050 [Clostridia bacterium]|nr:hypothetical protein [Clostridia bacterium]